MAPLYSWNIDVEADVLGVENLPHRCKEHMIRQFAASHSLRIVVDSVEKGRWRVGKDFLKLKDEDRRFRCTIKNTSKVVVEVECEHKHLHSSHIISKVQGTAVEFMFRRDADQQEVAVQTAAKSNTGTQTTEISIPHPKYGTKSPIKLSLRVSHIITAALIKGNSLGSRSHYTVDDLKTMGVVARLVEKDLEIECPQWINLLGSLGRFGQVARVLSELDPKAKAALTAVTGAFELFVAQQKRDERVTKLVEIMAHLYQMILDSEPLEKCKTLKDAIERLVNLTRECAYFISDYMNPGSFTGRMVVNATSLLSPVDECISQYEKKFILFRESFFTGVMLDTARISVRMWEKLQGMDEKIDDIQWHIYRSTIATHFPFAYRGEWRKIQPFLPRYRISTLDIVCAWGGDVNNRNVAFLVSRAPQCGKTNVARLVADHFHEQDRLGSAVLVVNSKNMITKAELVSTLIHDLSIYDVRVAKMISYHLSSNPGLSKDDNPCAPDAWFQHLIIEPLKSTQFTGPTMIIIDGITGDICNESFIELLLQLPPSIRLLITSSDDDVTQTITQFGSRINTIEMISGDSTLHWDANSYIYGYLKIFETHQPMLFSKHSLESTKAGISNACKGMYSPAYMICKLIALLPMEGASYFIGALSSRAPPETNTKECLEHLLSGSHCVTAIAVLVGRWPSSYSEATNQLLNQGFLCTNDSSSQQEFSNMLQLNLIQSSSFGQVPDSLAIHIPSACWNTALVFEALEYKNDVAIHDKMLSNDLLCPHCSNALQWLKILSKVATSHHPIHYDHKELQDGVISTDRRILSLNFYWHGFHVVGPIKSSHVAVITEPLKFSTTAGRITSVRFTLEDYLLKANFPGTYWYEAAIYRCASDEEQKHLSKIQQSVNRNSLDEKWVTKGLITNILGVHEAQHPLTGQGTWELQKSTSIPAYREYYILWHREPIDCLDDRSDDSPDEHGEGQGVGFVNSLQPGDRIAVIACTHLADKRKVSRYCGVSIEVLYAEYPEDHSNLRCTIYRHLSLSSTNRYRVI